MLCLSSSFSLNFKTLKEYDISNINLNEHNFVAIREVINEETINKLSLQLANLVNDNIYLKNYYLFLDTPGGSVISGNRLIDYLNYLNNTNIIVNCIAKTAISMGFVILQSCPGIRYALPSAILMQHQMSTLSGGNILNINSDIYYSNKLYEKMILKQSKRIGMTPDNFFDKTRDDWWLDGEMALENNVIDKLVNVGCSKNIINKKIKIEERNFFGSSLVKVSKCPIL